MTASIRSIIEGRRWWVLFLALLVFFTALRIMKIKADAPQDLSISAAVYTDEGFKTYSSRNSHLYGGWRWTSADEYKSWYRDSPVPAYLYTGWFKIFGVSFASIRMISVVFSLLTMILLFYMVKRYYDIYTAFAALALFGCNHFLVMYGRMAFYETYLLFFLMAGFFAVWNFSSG
jgi:4-amino-4-deoxy-L-arabinose transferase-like glycosyltransferase